jgi:hypothetical protein
MCFCKNISELKVNQGEDTGNRLLFAQVPAQAKNGLPRFLPKKFPRIFWPKINTNKMDLVNHIELQKLKDLLVSKSLGDFYHELVSIGINNVKDFNSMDSESLEELVGVLAKKNKPFHRASRKKFDSNLEDVKLGLGKTKKMCCVPFSVATRNCPVIDSIV